MKSPNYRFSLFLLALFIAALCACSPSTMDCIPPLYESFAYPISGSSENSVSLGDRNILPSKPWEIEAMLPDFEELGLEKSVEEFVVELLQVRTMRNHSEIWIKISLLNTLPSVPKEYLLIYRTDMKSWEVMPEQFDTLIVGHDNSLWGSQSLYDASPPFDNRLLSKYNEQEGRFQQEENISKLLAGVERDGIFYFSKVLLGADGMFWILVPNDAIYM